MSRARYPCAIFAGALSYEFLPRGGLPSAAGHNFPLTRGLLSERDNKARGRYCLLKSRQLFSRGRARARSGNAPSNGAFLSSQVVKAPPGLCQESTCSPLAAKISRRERFAAKPFPILFPRAKPRFCAAGHNLPLTRGLLSERDNKVRGRNRCLKSRQLTPSRLFCACAKKCEQKGNGIHPRKKQDADPVP